MIRVSERVLGSYRVLFQNAQNTHISPFPTPYVIDIRSDIVGAESYLTEQKPPHKAFNNQQGGIGRMLRSINKALEIIKAEDSETAVTVHTIRTWCKEGKIKYLKTGNKILVDMQSLLDFIAIKN